MSTELDNTRTRRVWYGHGSSRLISDDARNLLPADIVDEALAGFERVDAATRPEPSSLVATLSAQLVLLDRQRDRLARLLRDISA